MIPFVWAWSRITGKTGNIAEVTSAGELKVVQAPPVTPAGNTSINRPVAPLIDLNGGSTDLDVFVIPITETLTVQTLLMSAEDRGKESKVTLYYAPAGLLNGTEEILAMGHLSGMVVSPQVLDNVYIGDGTAAIILERRRMDTGKREIFGKWQGHHT